MGEFVWEVFWRRCGPGEMGEKTDEVTGLYPFREEGVMAPLRGLQGPVSGTPKNGDQSVKESFK